MKIVLLNDDFPPKSNGGAAVITQRLASALAKNGHDITVVTSSKKTQEDRSEDNYTIKFLKISYPSKFRSYLSLYNPSVSPRLSKLLTQLKPDVVHIHNVHTHLTYDSVRLAKNYGAKVIFTGHDVMPFFAGRLTNFFDSDNDGILDKLALKAHFMSQFSHQKLQFNPFRNYLIKRYLLQVDELVVVSNALANVYMRNGLNRTKVINNAINIKDWTVSDEQLTEFINSHHLSKNPKLFYGGRIRKDKGCFKAVEALKYHPTLELLFAGDNPKAMFEIAREQGMEDRVISLGRLKPQDMKYAYHATDATIIPSICFDSFPNNSIEAMACKKPIIISQFAGTVNLLTHKKDSFIINPFDSNQIEKSIKFLFSSEKRRASLAKSGFELVKRNLSEKDWVQAYLNLYQ